LWMAAAVWKKHLYPACTLLGAARLSGLTSRVCTTARFVRAVPGCRRSRFRTGPATSRHQGPASPDAGRQPTTEGRATSLWLL
jgi:hypothetical protein